MINQLKINKMTELEMTELDTMLKEAKVELIAMRAEVQELKTIIMELQLSNIIIGNVKTVNIC